MTEDNAITGRDGHATLHRGAQCQDRPSKISEKEVDGQVFSTLAGASSNDYVHRTDCSDKYNFEINCSAYEKESAVCDNHQKRSGDSACRSRVASRRRRFKDTLIPGYPSGRNNGSLHVIFYEKLEQPLVFVLKEDTKPIRFNSETDLSISTTDVSDIETVSDESVTPSCGSDSETFFEQRINECVPVHPSISRNTQYFPSRKISAVHDHRSFIMEPQIDSNHNHIKDNNIPVIKVSPVTSPLEKSPREMSPPSTRNKNLTLFQNDHRLMTVRESVSENDDVSSLCESTGASIGDDPFVRRDELGASPCPSPSPFMDNLKVPTHSDDCDSSTVSPILSRRNRLDASSSTCDNEPLQESPTLRRRLRRRTTAPDIDEVMELTSRLKLQTRRPSVHAWKQMHLINGHQPKLLTSGHDVTSHSKPENGEQQWSRDFRDKINNSLDWLRSELTSMREQDASIARQLLNVRKAMYKLKLQRSTLGHQLILDEAMEIEEERDELHRSRDCDITPDIFSPTLKQVGVTRMNLHTRRFSVF